MSRSSLNETLNTIKDHLGSEEASDDDTSRELLQQVHDDLEAVLATESVPKVQPVQTGIQAAIERFETEHPELVSVLNRAAELLAAIGV